MPRGGSGKGPQLVYEPIGGGWSKVTGTTDAAYWWHEETCRKQWTEPTQNQIRADDAVRTRKIPRLSQQSGPQHERTITGLAASPDKSSTKSTNSQRPVVPLELPILSPRASLSRRQSDILPDVPVKPRLKVGPVPRQKRRNPTQASPQGDYDQLRIDRLQRQRAAELKTYRTAFRIIDVDGSGAVDPPEVLKVLKMMGKKVDETKFWKVFRDLDLDNSSSLEYNEFAVVMDKLAQNKGPNAGISTKVRAALCSCVVLHALQPLRSCNTLCNMLHATNHHLHRCNLCTELGRLPPRFRFSQMLSPRAGAAPRAGAGDVSPTGDALPEITSADASLKSVHDAAILSPSGKDFME